MVGQCSPLFSTLFVKVKVRYGGTVFTLVLYTLCQSEGEVWWVFTLVLYTLCQSEGEVWWDSVHPCSLHSLSK